jgi:hypothetical protein
VSDSRHNTTSGHADKRINTRVANTFNSACAVDLEASCGGSLRARSAYPRRLCRRAPRIPLAAPDGGPPCPPVTHPFGHQLPGSPPQRIAEVCLLPTRIVLSYLTDSAHDLYHNATRLGMIPLIGCRPATAAGAGCPPAYLT